MAKKTPAEKKIYGSPDIFSKWIEKEIKETTHTEYLFHPTRRWRFDYAIPSLQIAVEIEGGIWSRGRHINPVGFLKDMEKYNTATAMGWRVLRTTPELQMRKQTLDMIKSAISKDETVYTMSDTKPAEQQNKEPVYGLYKKMIAKKKSQKENNPPTP